LPLTGPPPKAQGTGGSFGVSGSTPPIYDIKGGPFGARYPDHMARYWRIRWIRMADAEASGMAPPGAPL
jgi:hypothetical protein